MNIPESYIDPTTEDTRQFNRRESAQIYSRRRGVVLALAGVVSLMTLTAASSQDSTEYCVSTDRIADDTNFDSNLAAELRAEGAVVADLGQLNDVPHRSAARVCIADYGAGPIGFVLDRVAGHQAHVGSSEPTPTS